MKTLEELLQQPDEELRVICAEVLGWVWFTDGAENILVRQESAGSVHRVMKPGKTGDSLPCTWAADPPDERVPNYPQDLNACHEAEHHIEDTMDRVIYMMHLEKVCHDPETSWRSNAHDWAIYSATARQRTIALILTLQSP